MKLSKSFIIDSDIIRAYDTANDFFIGLGYEQKNAVKPNFLLFKKRISDTDNSVGDLKGSVIRLKISFKPVGNLQIYSTTLITVRCDYTVTLFGHNFSLEEEKIFDTETDQLKSKLVGKVFSKKIPKQQAKTCSRVSTNLCKEICENLQIQITFTLEKNKIRVGEEETIEVNIKNVGKDIIYLKKLENVLSKEFKSLETTHGELVENSNLNLDGLKIRPDEKYDIKISFEPLRSGSFEIRPKIHYLDTLGEENVIECHTKVYKVLDPSLPGRIPTGNSELDNHLFGGLPEKYAIVLTSPSIDEREKIINSFLKNGAELGEITYYITYNSENGKKLAKSFESNFFLFQTNPKMDNNLADMSNIYQIKGIGTLSNISIALTKALRQLDSDPKKTRRICIDIISDVLLEQKAVVTRKWLSALISDLKSKGFTILAVLNPLMHPRDQVHALLGLFDGEIEIFEKESKDGLENILRIKRLYNQKYSREELKLNPKSLRDHLHNLRDKGLIKKNEIGFEITQVGKLLLEISLKEIISVIELEE